MMCETKQNQKQFSHAWRVSYRNVSHTRTLNLRSVSERGFLSKGVCEMLTQERLKECVRYFPRKGEFVSRVQRRGPTTGKEFLGWIKPNIHPRKGPRVMFKVDGRAYEAHRLAFLYMRGKLPKYVDHKDRNSLNNRWNNLRECTQAQNNCNRAPRHNSVSGCTGVRPSYHFGQWDAYIVVNGKSIKLGTYQILGEAIKARRKAEVYYHGEFVFRGGTK